MKDYSVELRLIRKNLKHLIRKYSLTFSAEFSLEDLIQECFLSFWERGYFGKWNGTMPWNAFIWVGVRNWLLNFINLGQVKFNRQVLSLDTEYSAASDDGSDRAPSLGSTIPDSYDLEEHVISKISVDDAVASIPFLDDTLMKGQLTYREVFNALLTSDKNQKETRSQLKITKWYYAKCKELFKSKLWAWRAAI